MKSKLPQVELSGIRNFSEQFKGQNKLALTIGEPDFDTPQSIKDAAIKALEENKTHYPHAMGIMPLRKAIAKYESNLESLSYDEDQVIITSGATESLALAIWSLLDAHDQILIPTPSFPLYQSQVALVEGEMVLFETSDYNFQLDESMFDLVDEDKLKVILLTSPNNPTGTVYNQASLELVAEYMRKHPDVYVLIDEVYRSMMFGDAYPSIRQFKDLSERIVVIQSFSKSHAMTGWRIGYVVANKGLTHQMHKLHQNTVTGVSTIAQWAALEAFNADMSKMVSVFSKRADYVCQRLDQMGLDYVKPDGGLYVFPSIKKYGMDSITFATQLANKYNLILVPGYYFGAEYYVRISFGSDFTILEKGMDALAGYVKELEGDLK